MHGFELVREQVIPEINSSVRLFRHVKTGAELLSVENEDENKVFGITFCTPPTDSTGLPHIMEHSVLNGSRKYPVKEPFVELLKGSLATFLNAMTFPDKTTYPVASQNLQDFYNLIDVYMDAVFYPRIKPEILQQEGWHYELEDVNAPLTYKGVVFNEMKGAYSSPDNLLYKHTQQALFPDNTYGLDSGGDPEVIPDLTYEDFKHFHEVYYHPSNALIYFYGDDDPQERLRIMDGWLREFDPLEVNATIELQARFDQPRRLEMPYDAGEETTKKGMVTVSWLLAENNHIERGLAFSMLQHILVGTPASPLRKALIDSGLGEDIVRFGLEDDLRQLAFSTGLKGIDPEDADKVEALIMDTLARMASDGIDQETIAAALNTIEFQLREFNTGNYPRGLFMMMFSLRTWLYGGDPIAPLAFEEPLNAIKNRLEAEERVFEDLIRQYFLDNPHRSTVVLKPDPELTKRKAAAERDRLEQVRAPMMEDDLLALIEDTRRLKQMQETPDSPEALATIPSLKREDIEPEFRPVPLEVIEDRGSRILYHDLFTGGIFYLDVGLNLQALPQEFLPYVNLFGKALLEMGTKSEDFVRLSQRISSKTGGITPQVVTSQVRQSDEGIAWLFLRGKSTIDRVGELLAILRDVLLDTKFDDKERFRQIVLTEKAARETALIPAGHSVVDARLSARFHISGWAAEQIGGIEYLFFLRKLAEMIENDWSAVLEKLENVRKYLVNRGFALCNVTVDDTNWRIVRPELTEFLAALPAGNAEGAQWIPEYDRHDEGLTLPAQVNYVGKGARLYDLGYKLHGSAVVITRFLGTTWLWDRIRVQGGAYGGFARFDPNSGVFNYLSYRDPNLAGTLENYHKTVNFLRKLDLSDSELTKAIIGAIATIDPYELPDAKGFSSMRRYLTGFTDEQRQQSRQEVLDTTLQHFQQFADVLAALNETGQVVVLGSQQAIHDANVSEEIHLEVVKVL
jgi:presequence protease